MLELGFRELRRKAFHIAGIYIPAGYYFVTRETALLFLLSLNAVLLLIEWLRLHGKIKFPEILLRPHETKKVAAYIYFQMGALISILIFDKTIAIAALLMLAIGDTASGLAGALIKGGNIRHGNANNSIKPVSIMASMFLVCLVVGLVLLDIQPAPDMTRLSFYIYITGALGAVIGDAVPLRILDRSIDDNLMIPLLSGGFMTAAVFLT